MPVEQINERRCPALQATSSANGSHSQALRLVPQGQEDARRSGVLALTAPDPHPHELSSVGFQYVLNWFMEVPCEWAEAQPWLHCRDKAKGGSSSFPCIALRGALPLNVSDFVPPPPPPPRHGRFPVPDRLWLELADGSRFDTRLRASTRGYLARSSMHENCTFGACVLVPDVLADGAVPTLYSNYSTGLPGGASELTLAIRHPAALGGLARLLAPPAPALSPLPQDAAGSSLPQGAAVCGVFVLADTGVPLASPPLPA